MAPRLIDVGLQALVAPRFATGALVSRRGMGFAIGMAVLGLGVLGVAAGRVQKRDWEQPEVDATIAAALERARATTDPTEARRLRSNAAALLYTTYYNRAREAASRMYCGRVSEATADDAASITLQKVVDGDIPLPENGRVGCFFVGEALRRARLKDPASDERAAPANTKPLSPADVFAAAHGAAYDPVHIEALFKREKSLGNATQLLAAAHKNLESHVGRPLARAFMEAFTLHTANLLPVWSEGAITGLRASGVDKAQGLTQAEIGTLYNISPAGALKRAKKVEEFVQAELEARKAALALGRLSQQERDLCRKELAMVAREIGEAERKQKARRVAQKFYPLLPRTRVTAEGTPLRFRVREEDDGEEAEGTPPQQKRTLR